jgi:hypothetical protein
VKELKFGAKGFCILLNDLGTPKATTPSPTQWSSRCRMTPRASETLMDAIPGLVLGNGARRG